MTLLKVSSPAELISAVPFLVGFHPADSLIVVAMRAARIICAMRADLPARDAPEEEAKAAVLHLAKVVRQQQIEAVTIIGYGEEPRVTPAVLRLSKAFREAEVAIVDELRVTDGRHWSYLCEDPACCPPEGLVCEPAFSVVATEATYAGAVALPSREALAAQLESVTGDDREAMNTATARAVLRLAALAAERRPAPDAEAPADPAPDAEEPADPAPDAEEPADFAPAEELADPAPAEKPAEAGPDEVPGDAGPVDGEPPSTTGLRSSRFHDGKAPQLVLVTSADDQPGPTELGPGDVIWSSLGVAAPLPDNQPESAAEDAGLLTDAEHFYALVRSAGRTAVREAECCYRAGGRLSDDDAAWLGVLLLHTPVRDYAWARTRTHEWELALWSDLMRRVEPRYLPAPAALLAFVAWRMGLGPLSSVAVERALDQKLDYSLAYLMQGVLAAGLPPSVLDGWPAVAGMPPVSAWLDPEDDDPAPDQPAYLRPGPVLPPDGGLDQAREQPERRVAPTKSRGAAGNRPNKRDKRPQQTGRATRRRI
ncbi:DUF4192 family protein [Actinoplanes sp. NPDC049599]|uniref:DUF4192 domain-containing protein n=1 Tax=Actinoplanes sp. NPDC049599 TaxID=3363903 RepID=UPI0037BA3BAF